MRTREGILRDRYLYRGMGPTGTEGRFGFEVDGEVEMVALGALTQPTRVLLMHRGYADGLVVRLDDRDAMYTSGDEVLTHHHESLVAGVTHAAHVVDYPVGMSGIDGVTVRFVGAPALAYLPLRDVFSSWYPEEARARGVARDALLDLFGARVEVRVMNPGDKRCVVGLV